MSMKRSLHDELVTVIRKYLELPHNLEYISGRIENVRIHDMEFLDSQELGLVIEPLRGKCVLCFIVNLVG